MEELYQAIEEKIKAAGYPREISGQAVYEDICDQIEVKDNFSVDKNGDLFVDSVNPDQYYINDEGYLIQSIDD